MTDVSLGARLPLAGTLLAPPDCLPDLGVKSWLGLSRETSGAEFVDSIAGCGIPLAFGGRWMGGPR